MDALGKSPIQSPSEIANPSVLKQAEPSADQVSKIKKAAKLAIGSSPLPTKEKLIKRLARSGGERPKQAGSPPIEVIKQELGNISVERRARLRQTIELAKCSKQNPMPRPRVVTLGELCGEASKPEPFSVINKDEVVRILWRGCRADQILQMADHQSAGGKEPYNSNTSAPTLEEALAQVGELGSLPEFTDQERIARQFGRGVAVAAFAVPDRYLVRGSGSEGGWVCKKDAPVVLLAWEEGPPLVKMEKLVSQRINQSCSLSIKHEFHAKHIQSKSVYK